MVNDDSNSKRKDRAETFEGDAGDLNLRSTVNRFAKRLNRDLGEIERDRKVANLEREERRAILRRLLLSIEKDLQEATFIDLGDRYKLALSRIMSSASSMLRLVFLDRAKEREEILAFEVLAEDREPGCSLQFGELGEALESFPVAGEDCMKRLDLRLRRSLRNFFDRVQSYISDPKREPENALLKDREAVDVSPDAFDEGTKTASFSTDHAPIKSSNTVEISDESLVLDVDLDETT